ncbi:MAG: class I SAM-dependent methyltransferase [Aureispira sp.]|nr:class I SAM-dependent methyltransferase [Aureispira sp.]
MKDLSNKDSKGVNSDDRNRLRDLYDAAPYPEVLEDTMSQGTPLLEHWINAVLGKNGPALHPKANILVAGCGSGAEAITLAQQFPAATIVGVDFSAQSIKRAQALLDSTNLPNLNFEVADLTTMERSKNYKPFDFVLCHGVADYVLDTSAFMRTLASCTAPYGVIYMTVNSPHHPAERIRNAFSVLGISPASFSDTPDQRKLLQLMAKLMGDTAGIDGLANVPKAYLDIDVFAPIAHHDSIEGWRQQAEDAGLHFCGSMDALVGLTELTDEQLPLLYRLGRPELSEWMVRLRQRPGMQLLFSPYKLTEPVFDQGDTIWDWKPKLAACVGTLPTLVHEPNKAMPVTLRFQGLPDFVIHSTAYDLEVLRRCNGTHSLAEILKAIPVQGNLVALRACLFRAYHLGILA